MFLFAYLSPVNIFFSFFVFFFIEKFTLKMSTLNMLGGGNRDRTCDLLNANQMLSQLSYAPVQSSAVFLHSASKVNSNFKIIFEQKNCPKDKQIHRLCKEPVYFRKYLILFYYILI